MGYSKQLRRIGVGRRVYSIVPVKWTCGMRSSWCECFSWKLRDDGYGFTAVERRMILVQKRKVSVVYLLLWLSSCLLGWNWHSLYFLVMLFFRWLCWVDWSEFVFVQSVQMFCRQNPSFCCAIWCWVTSSWIGRRVPWNKEGIITGKRRIFCLLIFNLQSTMISLT